MFLVICYIKFAIFALVIVSDGHTTARFRYGVRSEDGCLYV